MRRAFDHQTSSGFQLSPDFRQRASSNASSIGRLSPIPAIVGLEPDWGFAAGGVTAAAAAAQQSDYAQQATDTPGGLEEAIALDQLAGSLADELSLRKDFMQGSVPVSLFFFVSRELFVLCIAAVLERIYV